MNISNWVKPLRIERDTQLVPVVLAISKAEGDAFTAAAIECLHEKEMLQLNKFPVEKRKRSFLSGRLSAKKAIKEQLNNAVLEHEILIQSGVFEFPLVREPVCAMTTAVSISHSDSMGAAIAYPDSHPMGLDIEKIQPDKLHVIKTQMTDKDLELIPLLAPGNEYLGLTMLWAAKEALSKAIKCGMMVSFKVLELSRYEESNGVSYAEFTHFSQYKVCFLTNSGCVLALALPRKSHIQNLDELQEAWIHMP